MTTEEIRNKAFDAAVHLAASGRLEAGAIVANATAFAVYLAGDANPTPAAKTRKAPAAPAAAVSVEAPAPVASPVTTGQLDGAAQPAATTAVAATPAKELTLDDVRNALVACQTRKGSKAIPQAILEKYSPGKVTGTLPKEDYAKVIAECAAA